METSVEVRLLPTCSAWERVGVESTGRVMMAGCEAEGSPAISSPDPATSSVCPAKDCCTEERGERELPSSSGPARENRDAARLRTGIPAACSEQRLPIQSYLPLK